MVAHLLVGVAHEEVEDLCWAALVGGDYDAHGGAGVSGEACQRRCGGVGIERRRGPHFCVGMIG